MFTVFSAYPSTFSKLFVLKVLFLKYMNNSNLVIYKKDCPVLKELIKKTNKPLYSFSLKNKNADIFIKNIELFSDRSSFTIKKMSFSLNIPGKYNIENAAAAISAAYVKGISFSTSAEKLNKFQGIKGRYEKVSNNKKIQFSFSLQGMLVSKSKSIAFLYVFVPKWLDNCTVSFATAVCYFAVYPPSMTSSAPVTYFDSSEAR